ncbi:class I adenylate-forming enzyme family protein [Streptomyces sp. NPDC127097]|uniref:class I adenylate-forming enzyme family protein n=1 Tax=Streptomyces sp. NPDC127097 TaxID=3347136 RepID=UPI003667E3DB
MTTSTPYQALARWAAEAPDRPALVHEHGSLGYGALARLVAGARRHHLGRGHAAGQRVGLVVRNDPESIVALLGLAATGAEVVLHDARSTRYERDRADQLAGSRHRIDPPALDAAREAGAGAEPPGAAHATALSLVTSGTGGLPKVVRKEWAATCANSAAFAHSAGITGSDRILCTTPLHHAFAFGAALLPALHTGAALVLAPHPPAPSALADALRTTGATVVQSVPFLYRSLLSRKEALSAPALRLCVSAGEPLDRETARAWRCATGRNLRDQYGATELGQLAFADDRPEGPLRLVPGIRAAVRDDHGVLREGTDAEGELCFRHEGPPVVYRGLPELTAQATTDGWFRTGDIGVLPGGGTVQIRGRAGRRITVAGRKVDPAEVELALSCVPGVRECLVSAPPAGAPGPPDRFVAFIAAGPEVTELAVRRHLAGLLSPYKIPTRIHLTGRLPRTGSGKVHAARLWQEAEER